jgi:outer membrane protein assembly factor BamB
MVSGSNDITANGQGYASVLLADISGNEELAAIVATASEEGLAMIKALDADGLSIWETTFQVPGDPPLWNVGGITNWTAGYFTSIAHEDILVSVRATKSLSDQLFLLEGETGKVLWTKSVGGYYSGCNKDHPTGAGGSHMAIFDWDGDGLDEILSLHTSLFAVYDGPDGATLINRWTTDWCGPNDGQLFSQGFHKHPIPVVADFLGEGSEQILLAGIDATIAVVQFDGDVVWHTPFFSGSPIRTMQGVGDLNGDSIIDLVSVGHCGSGSEEVQILDARNGTVQWSLSIPDLCDSWMVPTHVSTIDLDGDGLDEALFTHKNNIYAVGVDAQVGAVLLWRATFEPSSWLGQLGEVVIADVDGSGIPQLIVNTASGYMYGLGQSRSSVND